MYLFGRYISYIAMSFLPALSVADGSVSTIMEDFVSIIQKDQPLSVNSYLGRGRLTNIELEALEALWNEKTDYHPDLPWQSISKSGFKLEIASALLQAHKNGQEVENFNDIKTFVIKHAKNDDVTIAAKAILAIGVSGDDSDIPLLKDLAQEESLFIRDQSVLALKMIGTDAAMTALQELEAN